MTISLMDTLCDNLSFSSTPLSLESLPFFEAWCNEDLLPASLNNGTGTNNNPKKDNDSREDLHILETVIFSTNGLKLTVPKILKNSEGSSFAMVVVATVNTPSGKVNPHQPILNGNFDRVIEANAKKSQTSANPHMISPTTKPKVYRKGPAEVCAGKLDVSGKTLIASFPSCMMPKEPWPNGPNGRKTDTITSLGGILCIVRR